MGFMWAVMNAVTPLGAWWRTVISVGILLGASLYMFILFTKNNTFCFVPETLLAARLWVYAIRTQFHGSPMRPLCSYANVCAPVVSRRLYPGAWPCDDSTVRCGFAARYRLSQRQVLVDAIAALREGAKGY